MPRASSKESPCSKLPIPEPIAPAATGLARNAIPVVPAKLGSSAEPKKLPKRGSTMLISNKSVCIIASVC